jgi:hypothetical protein
MRRSALGLVLFALVCAVAVATALHGAAQRTQEQPSISFGMAKISLGMTVEQVKESLAGTARHITFLSDKETSLVYRDGVADEMEGQITFYGGRVAFAQYQLPNVQSADALAQEIAGAIDSVQTKTCSVSNFSAHGTGGGHSDTVFACGSRTITIMTTQLLGSNVKTINVSIEIGETQAK